MTRIEKGTDILTLINVFSVAPEKQQELVTLLIDATQKNNEAPTRLRFGQYPSQHGWKQGSQLRAV